MDITSLIINLVCGAIGGNAAAAIPALKDKSLGTLWNSIVGALGGGLGGALLQILLPALVTVAQGGSVNVGALVGQVVSSGVGGAILMVIVSWIKAAISK
jgi:hypothetical protein